MNFAELYTRIIVFWPEEIDIADGYPAGDSGYMFPKFNKIYEGIEGAIDYKNDHWANIGAWSFSQAFHSRAKELIELGLTTLNTRSVSHQEIDKWIRFNLDGDGWETLKNEYRGL